MEGTFLYGNRKSEELIGYRREELIGKNFLEVNLLPENSLNKAVQLFQANLEGKSTGPDEIELITKEGRLVPVEISTNVIQRMGQRIVLSFARDITERKLAEEMLQKSEEKWRTVIMTSPDGIAISSMDGYTEEVSERVLKMFGYASAEELIGKQIFDFIDPSYHEKAIHLIGEMVNGNYTGVGEYLSVKKDGTRFFIEANAEILRNAQGESTNMIFIMRDITERKRTEEALRTSEERHRTILEDIDEGYYESDLAGNFTFVNDAECRDLGYSREELIGMNYRQYSDEETAKKIYELFLNIYDTGKPVKGFPGQFISKDGRLHFNEVSASLIRDANDKPIGFRGISHDVTERREAEEKIRQIAYHDSLTDLPNRKLFSDRLDIALAHAQRNKKEVGIAMLDLDNFKDVNDTLGHAVGDLLLKAAAERLIATLRKGDTVARFGGDEFALILPDLKGVEDAIQVAQKIVDSFRNPFLIDTHQLLVTTSIGIAVYPDDETDEGTLLKNADIAMYQAKEAGRDRYQIYKEA